jgi:hypothetical protein
MSFKKRKKVDVAEIRARLDKVVGKKSYEADGTEWTLTKDATGNGSAIIRFLPAKDVGDEDLPFVKLYSHGYKQTGQWFIEHCPTTINEKCPQCEANSLLWQSGLEKNKLIASERKRKLNYYANIYVVQDKANPESEGKVFKFRFGSKIMDKIVAMGSPEFDGEEPVDVTDVYNGANFLLKAQMVNKQVNYDKSKFANVSELCDGDEGKLEEVYNSMHPLKAIIAKSEFKSYDELHERMSKVLGDPKQQKPQRVQQVIEDDEDDLSSLNQVSDEVDVEGVIDVEDDLESIQEENLDDWLNSLNEENEE